ncbi:hypothetical protein BJV82DRAFT_514869 [Fennellomyces sp. T-0311]|nr:hypothetical protein BJV82DRAFT_514869 [Fennellomyces sp. T-0311]
MHHKDDNKHDASIPALLNTQHDDQDFLPTPVTPANGFPLPLSEGRESSVIFAVSGAHSDTANKRLSNTNATTNTDKNFTCRECDQTFTRPHNLKSHLATHSPERPFQCEICNHHFRRQHDLKRHKKLHTGERPYVCQSCSRSFARLDALNRHQRAEGGSACTNVNSKKVNHDISLNTQRTTPPRRPIPQLHIPHPASQPLPGQVYPHPPQPPPPENLLPSPNVLSTLPVSESPDLVPIHPFSASADSKSPYPRLPSPWERLEQENSSLKAEIARLRAECEKKNALASEVHDLRVENKVLRSLIVDAKRDRPDSDDDHPDDLHNKRHRPSSL